MPAPPKKPIAAVNTEQEDDNRVSEFRGLNNVVDPLKLTLEWAQQCDNVNITRKGAYVRARGYTATAYAATAITGGYATKDLQRLYLVDNGSLVQLAPDMSVMSTLATGLSTTLPVYWEEINGIVYLTNGVDYWLITGEGAFPWGISSPSAPAATVGSAGSLVAGTYQIVCTVVDPNGLESSNSDVVVATVGSPSQYQGSGTGSILITNIPQVAGFSTNVYISQRDGGTLFLLVAGAGDTINCVDTSNLGHELPFWNLNRPRGIKPTKFAGRIYTMEYYPAQDITALWRSLPMHYHHFDPGGEGIIIPGQGMEMRASDETTFMGNERLTQRGMGDTLIIGTDREIFSWDEDQLVKLASYGVVPGYHMVNFKNKVYFWTKRGLCRALPFENMTEGTVSVPPGLSAGAAVIEEDGTRRYVVALQRGGTAYNPYVGY